EPPSYDQRIIIMWRDSLVVFYGERYIWNGGKRGMSNEVCLENGMPNISLSGRTELASSRKSLAMVFNAILDFEDPPHLRVDPSTLV
ncbi:hypothetical protein L195_g047398, partial [Trifolium pratense]